MLEKSMLCIKLCDMQLLCLTVLTALHLHTAVLSIGNSVCLPVFGLSWKKYALRYVFTPSLWFSLNKYFIHKIQVES